MSVRRKYGVVILLHVFKTGDVVVHLFLPPQREFYNLEEFYGNATSIELPFEDEKPFGR